MSLLPRGVSGRRYAVASGVWFMVAGVIVGAVAIAVTPELSGRAFGALLACVLFVRGVVRLRRAGVATSTTGAASAGGERGREDASGERSA